MKKLNIEVNNLLGIYSEVRRILFGEDKKILARLSTKVNEIKKETYIEYVDDNYIMELHITENDISINAYKTRISLINKKTFDELDTSQALYCFSYKNILSFPTLNLQVNNFASLYYNIEYFSELNKVIYTFSKGFFSNIKNITSIRHTSCESYFAKYLELENFVNFGQECDTAEFYCEYNDEIFLYIENITYGQSFAVKIDDDLNYEYIPFAQLNEIFINIISKIEIISYEFRRINLKDLFKIIPEELLNTENLETDIEILQKALKVIEEEKKRKLSK